MLLGQPCVEFHGLLVPGPRDVIFSLVVGSTSCGCYSKPMIQGMLMLWMPILNLIYQALHQKFMHSRNCCTNNSWHKKLYRIFHCALQCLILAPRSWATQDLHPFKHVAPSGKRSMEAMEPEPPPPILAWLEAYAEGLRPPHPARARAGGPGPMSDASEANVRWPAQDQVRCVADIVTQTCPFAWTRGIGLSQPLGACHTFRAHAWESSWSKLLDWTLGFYHPLLLRKCRKAIVFHFDGDLPLRVQHLPSIHFCQWKPPNYATIRVVLHQCHAVGFPLNLNPQKMVSQPPSRDAKSIPLCFGKQYRCAVGQRQYHTHLTGGSAWWISPSWM